MNIDRLLSAVTLLVRSIMGEYLPGLYRYRYVQTVGDRVELQSLKKGIWPDLVGVEIGAIPSGSWTQFQAGAIVTVAFEDADPKGTPIVVSGPPKGREGHLPSVANLDASGVNIGASATRINLGSAQEAVHRVNDTGTGGTITIATAPGPPGSGVAVTYTDPSGVITPLGVIAGLETAAPPIVIPIATKALTGAPETRA